MSVENEIRQLGGETLAIQALLVGLTSSLAKSDQALLRHIRDGFDGAAAFLEQHAVAADGKLMHVNHALRVVEELRLAVFGKDAPLRHGV